MNRLKVIVKIYIYLNCANQETCRREKCVKISRQQLKDKVKQFLYKSNEDEEKP